MKFLWPLPVDKRIHRNSYGFLRIPTKINGNPTNVWNFKEYNDINLFISDIIKDFPRESVVFCGITYNDGKNNVFLIGRDSSDKFWKMDGQLTTSGQLSMCDLNTIECYNQIKNGQNWYILEYM